MNTNPFAQFKPYKKHPTSEWPLFSDFLDDVFDLGTAPAQYFFYASWIGATSASLYYSRLIKRAVNIPPLDLASSVARSRFVSYCASRRWIVFVLPFCYTILNIVQCANRRTIEQDRNGSRYNEYFRRARNCDLDDETALLLAKDVVMRSDTMLEGRELLERALNHLQQQDLIPEPKFTPEGLYVIPEHLRPTVPGGAVAPGAFAEQYQQHADGKPQVITLPQTTSEFQDMMKSNV